MPHGWLTRVFAVATLQKPIGEAMHDLTDIGLTAADCLARAIARGVYEATALALPGCVAGLSGTALPGFPPVALAMTRLRLMVACLLALVLLLLLGWQAQREQLVKACPGRRPARGRERLRPLRIRRSCSANCTVVTSATSAAAGLHGGVLPWP